MHTPYCSIFTMLASIALVVTGTAAPLEANTNNNMKDPIAVHLDARGRVDMDALLTNGTITPQDLVGRQVFGRTPVDAETFARIEALEHRGRSAVRSDPPSRETTSICWSDSFPLPHVNGSIYAAVLFGDDLVVGGDFTIAGKTANYIASWNGSDWSPLGEGMNGAVYCLAIHDNNLVAAGDFTLAGGVWANRIATWDGANWSPLGQGTSGHVNALTSWSGDLIATGDFMVAGQTYANGIARWDGSAWHPLTDGLNESGNGLVTYQDSLLVVSGSFSAAGTNIAEGIAQWNGNTWKAMGPGAWSGTIDAMIEHDGLLVVGGDFEEIGLARVPYLAAWNGTSWIQYGGAIQQTVTAMYAMNGALTCSFGYAPYGPPSPQSLLIASWDGLSWTTLISDEDSDNNITLLTEYQGQLVAGVSENNEAFLASYDGDEWFLLSGPGIDGGVTTAVEYEGDLIVGGDFRRVGRIQALGVARWNGTTWDSLGGGIANHRFDSWDTNVLTTVGTDLYVGGDFTFVTSSLDTVRNIARWNGSEWVGVGGGVRGEVLSATAHNGMLYVGGWFTDAGGVSVSNVAAWDGNTWSSPGAGLPFYVFALLSYDSLLVAGSPEYYGADAVSAWNGTSWTSLDFQSQQYYGSDVRTLAEYNGDLIIGGRLDSDGAGGFQGVARWDGIMWHPLGSGLSLQGSFNDNIMVTALTVHAGRLIAGGRFLEAGGQPARQIAAWDGTEWWPIDSGIGTPTDNTNEVELVKSWAGNLIIGGEFAVAGGVISGNMAVYSCAIPITSAAQEHGFEPPGNLFASPNPFYGTTRISYSLPATSRVTLEVYDASGRRVRRLVNGQKQRPGPYGQLWDGRGELGLPVPAGIYFYRLQTEGGTWTGKTVHLR